MIDILICKFKVMIKVNQFCFSFHPRGKYRYSNYHHRVIDILYRDNKHSTYDHRAIDISDTD